eukprot:TRINITY_DN1321_c0_g1_i6.p7 TRINITY_DN1321_c0_g1~~TRINITY_DN1321_c0_g1_i6.p7  ORF type:complete len:101 (-),score=7.18 TRINITY_DN1321_c0_g1_i6:1149-1451(-)
MMTVTNGDGAQTVIERLLFNVVIKGGLYGRGICYLDVTKGCQLRYDIWTRKFRLCGYFVAIVFVVIMFVYLYGRELETTGGIFFFFFANSKFNRLFLQRL